MEIRLSQSKSRCRLHLHRGHFFAALVLVAALLIAACALFTFQPDGLSATVLIFLALVLFAALGMGRGLLTPSIKEFAFYFFAIIAAGLIWPGAQLAIVTYKASGYVALAAFMAFVFALAVALVVLSAYLLTSHDGET